MIHSKILIIDDSLVDCKLMEAILLKANPQYQIIFNNDGNDVSNQIIKENVSAIILDLLIESKNGIEILNEIKENELISDVPIIICSSIGDQQTIKKTLLLGAYDYFEKPLNDMAFEFGFSLKVRNALEIKHKTDHVNFLRNHDELTGLYTRKYFEMELNGIIQRNISPISIIMLDVNGLKLINDAYGYDVGDNVLREISNILNDLSEKCTCSARWGNDEMVILLPFSGRKAADEFIMELNQRINLSKGYNYDISFGCATETNSLDHTKYLVQRAEDNLFSNKILESSSIRSNMIESFIKTLHDKNPREELHSHRVSFISGKIATELGFSEYEIKRVQLAGLMHDIGKISISEEILNKPDRLDENEWNQIKKHPEYGFKILSTSVDTLEIANAVLAHHERWDGKGYPKGIAEGKIPIMARIISIADTFDAITSVRTYKDSIDEESAVEEIKRCSGTQFDSTVVNAFLRYREKQIIESTND